MRGFTLLEMIVVLAVTAILALFAASWGAGMRRALAMEEAVSGVTSALLAAEVAASTSGGSSLTADPSAGLLLVERRGGTWARIALPKGVRFGFAEPPRTTGGSLAGATDDGIHLDGRGNQRAFLGDGLPEGSLSLAVYLVEVGSSHRGRPESRAVTMSAPTGRIQVYRRSVGGADRWLLRG
jgi:prepilin-type N-terminal cleavage/methylation domain-containing protein